MSLALNDRVVVDIAASNLAFRAGQVVERLLLERSIELTSRSGSSTVTAEHVESCLDHTIVGQLLERMREDSNVGTAEDGGNPRGDPREAA
jgi:hypothetical protein